MASKPQGRGAVPVSGGGRPSRALPAGRKPSITDVARLAGVSYQTVSRVINAAPDVSAETRARVLKVIQDVGYRRNMTATALVTSRSTVIGIVTDGSPRYGPVATLLALETAAREAGYGSTVVTVKEPYEASVQSALDSLEDAGVDGIIVIAPLLTLAAAVRRARLRIPVEMIAAGASSTPSVFTYSEDQELGARMATQHLIDLGHEDIAHVGGSAAWFDGRVRKRGWESALRDAGLLPGLYVEGDWSPGKAYETGLLLVGKGVPGAIFAASDHTALGLIRAFSENGIRVPDDVSVVGYDDIEGSDFFLPPLTTVRQDFTALGRGSVERLVGSIEGREVDWTPISPILVVRDSTTPPREKRTASGTLAPAQGIAHILLIVLVISGVLAAFGGVLLAGQVTAGDPTSGTDMELTAIAAVILGGTDLFGGKGTIMGTVIGALFLSIIQDGLILFGMSAQVLTLVTGAIIVLVVIVNAIANGSLKK